MANQSEHETKELEILPDKPTASASSQHVQELADGSKRSTWRVALILIALFLALFVSALDATIVATAMPVITHDLKSAAGYTWVGGAYLLSNCAAGPIWASLSDIWGRRPILLSSIAVFIAGSIICAIANTMLVLIVGRAVQGAAGGSLIMLVHICISDLFSVSLIIGLTEGVWATAGGIGPVIGGAFASLVSWRWCCKYYADPALLYADVLVWINLPICGVVFVLVLLFLDIKHEHTSFKVGMKAIDWFGIITFLGSTLMLLLALNLGGAVLPWSSPTVIALLVTGFVLVSVFIYVEARVAKYPLIPLDMLKKVSIIGSLLVTFFHGLVFMGSEYYLPLFFQSVMQASPLLSGVLLLPLVVSTAIAGLVCGFIIHRSGRFCEVIWAGCFLMCVGNGLYITWGVGSSTAQVVGIQIVSGLGAGLLFEPPLIAIQSQTTQQDVASVTSTFTFARNVAVTLCVVVGGSMFQNSMDHKGQFLANAGIPQSILEKLTGKNAAANLLITETLSDPTYILAIKQAFAWSTRNMYIMFTAFAFCALLSSLLVKKSHLAQEHTETVTGVRQTEEDR